MSKPGLCWVESSNEDSTLQMHTFVDFSHNNAATMQFICEVLKYHHSHHIIVDCELCKSKGGVSVCVRYEEEYRKKAIATVNDIDALIQRTLA